MSFQGSLPRWFGLAAFLYYLVSANYLYLTLPSTPIIFIYLQYTQYTEYIQK